MSRRARAASLGGAVAAFGALALALADLDPAEVTTWFCLVVVITGLVTNIGAAKVEGPVFTHGGFMVAMLAASVLSPAAMFVVAAVIELGTFVGTRYRVRMIGINVIGSGLPAAGAAWALGFADRDSHVIFYVALPFVAAAAIVLNNLLIATLAGMAGENDVGALLRSLRNLVPAWLVNIGVAIAAVGAYDAIGLAAAVLILANMLAFTYMARLVVTAGERTRQFASLSWGVISSHLRNLAVRDPRAARHAAATARFARDIAEQAGLSAREQELAHTAGLLHDIGTFALSDRVLERDVELSRDDWRAIQQHPVLGAEMVKDLGVYGPLAEIIRSHHERLDGRGYPDGLSGDAIPELSKVVAVAEVYDTLTAPDTYRTPMSSFEALTEMRRVAGKQLDGRYVEALAALLTGRGVEYRHADAADFEAELDIERRINEAAQIDFDSVQQGAPGAP